MAADAQAFKYCKVCRVHYQNGRKHRYGRNHVKALDLLIAKFKKKVVECKQYLKFPEAMDGELEPGATFWCHFCEQNVPKHVTDRMASLKFGGLFQHFASPQHHKKTHAFWKENGGDKNAKKDFLVTSDDYIKYQLGCKESLEKLAEKMHSSSIQTAERIRKNEMDRSTVFSEQHCNQATLKEPQTVTNVHGVMQNPTGWHNGVRVWRSGIIKSRLKQAAMKSFHPRNGQSINSLQDEFQLERSDSSLPTLSCVKTPTNSFFKNKKIGNIHTGALPPWLRGDGDDDEAEDDSESPAIGPSLEDFKRHVAKSKKKRSNTKRVGANFDHTAETSDNWLPSFGRVWNAGPRWHSRREYKNENSGSK